MSDGPLSPEEVAHRGFGVSFRGFDTAEVRAYLQRVANELRTGTARERELHRRLADAEHRAANPVIEGEVLTRAMGEEMARVLASAQHAANGLKEKAEENAARILREAHEQAQRIRAQAESILAVRTDEANVEAADIRRAAEAETEALLERARAEAAAAITDMQERARQMVQDAQATRARVLGDLARRRRLLQTQVEQLRAGRDRLLDAYRLVRSTTDDVADELQRVEDEARRAAGAAGERLAAEPVPDELDDVLHAFSGVEPAVAPADAADGEQTTTPLPGEAEAPEVADPAAQIAAVLADHVADDPDGAQTTAGAGPAGAGMVAPKPGERRPLRLLRRPKEATRPLDTAPGPVADEEVRVVAQPPGSAEPDAPPAEELAVEAMTAPSDEPAATAAPDAAVDDPAAPAPDGPAPEASVEELFARIRAGRAEAVAKAREVLAGAEDDEGGDEADAGQEAPAAIDLRSGDVAEAVAGPAGDESLLRRRDAAVGEIESRLARRLKRALQDEQNEVLDRLRSARAGAGATDVLPSPADQAARYASAATELLRDAAGAGRSFVAAGGTGAPPQPVDEVAGGLASWLAEPLRRALDRAFESDRSDPSLVFERIGAAYRECKAQRIEGLAGDAITAAFSLGAMSALPAGAEARWVVDDDGRPCPDCDDNALAGPTAAGEPFPTGQSHPPAHAGCRCLLAPVRLAAAVPDAG